MKLTLVLALVSLSVLTAAKQGLVRKHTSHHHHHHHHHHTTTAYPGTPSNASTRTTTSISGGWEQNPSGKASFTAYHGCQAASCGQIVSGYSAAVNQLAFGANSGAGGACGRCFKISANYDPYTPDYRGPWGNTIVVRVNDLCPVGYGNNPWCGQTVSKPLNDYNVGMHFDLCIESHAQDAFFPGTRRALLGTYEEVSCNEWTSSGRDGQALWNGSCMNSENVPFWPAVGNCPNVGTPPA